MFVSMIQVHLQYGQLLRASDNAMRKSSFFHPLVLQGKWVKNNFTPLFGYHWIIIMLYYRFMIEVNQIWTGKSNPI